MSAIECYEILGVGRDATPEQIKSAYRREALRWHPDRNPGDQEAERRFKTATEAYEILRDPEKRQAHSRGQDATPPSADVPGYAPWPYGPRRCGRGRGRRCGGRSRGGRRRWAAMGGTRDAAAFVDLDVGPVEAALGCVREIEVHTVGGRQVLAVRLPPGLADGDEIQLAGLGYDIRLRVSVTPIA